jgi:hypothetical protein
MRGQVRADDLRPPPEHRADRGSLLPAVLVEQAADGLAQPLRVIPADPPAGRTGLTCPAGSGGRRPGGERVIVAGRDRPGPFGIIGFTRP